MYDLRFPLARRGGPCDALAAEVRSRFAELSPVTAAAAVDHVGQVMELRFAGVAPMPVAVREITDCGWVFATSHGHPAHPADIRFSFECDDAAPALRVTATGVRPTLRLPRTARSRVTGLLTGAARGLWAEFADAIDSSAGFDDTVAFGERRQ